jgi:HAD superfamily hydrolase (TIGR01509 family)
LLIPTFMAVSAEYSDRPFYLLRDVVCTTLGRIVGVAAGRSRIAGAADCMYGELLEMERRMWEAAVPRAEAVTGAVETIWALRDAGLRTGIVSYTDTWLFHGLLDQTGLAGATDVEMCTEQARSCKPHPAIFERALDTLGAAPVDALFVGDSVEQDIVGANRVGMTTALVSGAEYSISVDDLVGVLTEPDHRISRLEELLVS